MIDEIECICSVLLAILFAHAIGAANISWAAFSGYMVMRGHLTDSLLRGVLRIVGTACGAALGLAIVPLVRASLPAAAISGALIGGLTLYGAMTGRRAYAWLFVGLTFEMVLLDTMEHPAHGIAAFARTRVLEVLAGTVACVLVSCLSTVTARRRWPAERTPSAKFAGWHPHAARHAMQAASALLLLPFLWRAFAIPELAQSAVTIMAVMLVPLTSLGTSGLAPVSRRLVLRIAGCLAGSALAALCLFAARGAPAMSPAILIAGSAIGVAIGRHIENSKSGIVYAGTQFTLAILVTLVPDSYADAAIGPATERLTGILVGMALLEPVLLAWYWVIPRRPTNGTPAAPESTDL
ncbi:FUSC family protein [Sphingomonas abietis]|uniref:FUSC family protein n=1 Tax=Sphingomonas abietis TaxID=3012344 RepID=A0ABY7NL19_9SPHN|nr:FUSC family protein [Sphingomonas abietis]WBO21665.1 FUSC family protein [Sphingomonas abietis]